MLQSSRIRMGQGNKIKPFLNYLLKLPWLLDGSVCNVFPSSFYASILIRCIVFIVSAKIQEHEGNTLLSSFYAQLSDYYSKVLAYSTEHMSSTVPAAPSPRTYTAVSWVVQFSARGEFVDD